MRKMLLLLLVGSVGITFGYAHPFTGQDGKETTSQMLWRDFRVDKIDILAEVGTPVYAMYDGVITEIESSIPDEDSQPAWGNYIYYRALVDGKELYIFYAHLQSGNAIGYNPRKQGHSSRGTRSMPATLSGTPDAPATLILIAMHRTSISILA